tara:strand:- start:330 stop:989 length:660 start_codon:yes stop_codon:yes gene_type:complete
MLYSAHKLISKEAATDLKERLIACPDWQDGKETALGRAKDIKSNLQLAFGDSYHKFSQEILSIFKNDNAFQLFTMPKKVFSLLFSRTGVGGFYGTHCDHPYNPNGRRDLSFTLFLNDASEYDGGKLILDIPPMKKAVKLNAGEIVIYPTKYLHEVTKVDKGERIVCVGWIQSQIANDFDREILLNLRTALGELRNIENIESTYSKINLTYFNLYKRFLD